MQVWTGLASMTAVKLQVRPVSPSPLAGRFSLSGLCSISTKMTVITDAAERF